MSWNNRRRGSRDLGFPCKTVWRIGVIRLADYHGLLDRLETMDLDDLYNKRMRADEVSKMLRLEAGLIEEDSGI